MIALLLVVKEDVMKYLAVVIALILSGAVTWSAYAQSASPSPSPMASVSPSPSAVVPSAAPRTGYGSL